jgi:ankyrin repeat protein
MIGWPVVERIRKEKHKHESALKLVEELIKKSQRYWSQSINAEPTEVNINTLDQRGRGAQSDRQGGGGREGEVENDENVQTSTEENRRHETPSHPLFVATSNGILEIAQEILDKFPQSIELVNQMGQNILHLAVMHRQRGVFRVVKNNNRLVTRMSSTIDHNGYTLLHQVAHMKHYHGGTKPGPALELQEEIKWFKVS